MQARPSDVCNTQKLDGMSFVFVHDFCQNWDWRSILLELIMLFRPRFDFRRHIYCLPLASNLGRAGSAESGTGQN